MTENLEPVTAEPADFFMVWTKTGWAPRKAHETFDSASTEAERLARAAPGKKFIVLQAVAKFSVATSLPASNFDIAPGDPRT